MTRKSDLSPFGHSRVESETEIIQTYLAPLAQGMPGALGLTDDAAVITVDPGSNIVVSSDPIIAGVHFFPSDRAEDVAWKALAVNVSDIAAKGARPFAYIMTLAFPEAPERAWLSLFAQGLATAQVEFGCVLVGGDTDRTPGPLSIGITMIGTVPKGGFVRRRGAAAGDHVFVTGTIGDAALGLAIHRDAALFSDVLTDGDRSLLVGRYLRPSPRHALADVLRHHASAALDVSDGFLKDLRRLAEPFGISLKLDSVPISQPVRAALARDPKVADAILGGGDDYELIVAVPPQEAASFAEDALKAGVNVTEVGVLEDGADVCVLDADGDLIEPRRYGYDHFLRS